MIRQGDLVRETHGVTTVTVETRLPYFSPALIRELEGVLTDPRVRGSAFVWLGCAGRAGVFHYGGDLEYLRNATEAQIREYGESCARLVELILTHPRPTAAVIAGDCFGGGLEGALACRTVTALPGSRLGFPEYTFGAFPGMGGRLFATELCLHGLGRLNIGETAAGPLHLARSGAGFLHPTRVFEETRQWSEAMAQALADPINARQIQIRARLQRRAARSIEW